MSRLSLPARKSFICELQNVQATTNDTQIANLNVWKVCVMKRPTTFSVVWIQATIVKGDDEKEFIVDDSTAVARILLSASVPDGCSSPKIGMYVMLVGELVATGTVPTIRAMKIQDMSADPNVESLWPLEAIDVQLNA